MSKFILLTAWQRRGSGEFLVNELDSRKSANKKPNVNNHKWPLLRSKHSRSDMVSVIGESKGTQDPSQAATSASPKLRHMPSHPNLMTRKPELLSSKKRKASVPDVSLGPMTTVQEGLLDSRK